MNWYSYLQASSLLALNLFAAISTTARADHHGGKTFVCAPCDSPCDTKVHDKPGTCPTCHMTLVETGTQAAEAPTRKKVAILIFDGVEIIDFTGPYEMFGVAGFEVFTVAATKSSISTYLGMMVTPTYAFAEAPQPDVLVIPGGGLGEAMSSEPTLKYIKAATEQAQFTMSVCNGAFLLAHAGLLDGLTATTTRGNIARLTERYPNVKVVYDQRYTDNGKIITTGGLSAGIDGALHVIERMLGPKAAEEVAIAEEYPWHPGSSIHGQKVVDNPRVASGTPKGKALYGCPVKEHPNAYSEPGLCPECHMALEKRRSQSRARKAR